MADRRSLARGLRASFVVVSLSGTFILASSALAQSAGKDESSKAYAVVNRHEVRVFFPPVPPSTRTPLSTLSAGGVPARIAWLAQLDGIAGPTMLGLRFRGNFAPEGPPSLDVVMRAGRADLCREAMMGMECSGANVAATLENGRVVLSYRDSAEIRQLFGFHQDSILLLLDLPPAMGDAGALVVPVRYTDPPIVLDSAERLAVGRERRRREAGINRYERGIAGGPHGLTLSMTVGDSVPVYVQYYHCRVDLCSEYDHLDSEARDWGRWILRDSSVATLHRWNGWAEAAGFPSNDSDRLRMLVALRPGRTTLRVVGVRTAADTMPSLTPLDSILEREIIVTPARRRP